MNGLSLTTRISINLSSILLLALVVLSVNMWAQPAEVETAQPDGVKKEQTTSPTEVVKTFDLPSFMQGDTAPRGEAEKPNNNIPGAPEIISGDDDMSDRLDVAPNDDRYTNSIAVGDIIVSPRQRLLKQPLADIRLEEVPIRDALRYLAEAAGINYILPQLTTDSVTVNMRMPPFKAMEVLANNFGLGIYEEDGLWFIRKKDQAEYFAKIYKIKNIHLGESNSGGGTTSDDGDTTTSSSTTSTTTTGTTTSGVSTSSGGDVVMTTLKEILGMDVKFGGTIDASGKISSAGGNLSQSGETSDNSSNTEAADYTYVSYDADANTLFIIATATQHEWVSEYLNAIDNPSNNIAIEAMFLESSRNPSDVLGINWEGASAISLKTTEDTLPFGTIKNPKFPWGGLIESTGFSASLRAFSKQTDSQIARYPSVVTQNGREVKIQTTQKIPLSAIERVVQNDTSTTVGIQDLGTQEIGTTITITPRQINEKLVQLKISISISTAGADSDDNTNRVSTNETTYEGTVNVPVGFTLAIGGLERVQEDISIKKLPGLGDVPLFGFLFKDKGKTLNRSSIFLFITPTVLATNGTTNNAFVRPSDGDGLSRDWIENADDVHRAWRRNKIDPSVDKILDKANKK